MSVLMQRPWKIIDIPLDSFSGLYLVEPWYEGWIVLEKERGLLPAPQFAQQFHFVKSGDAHFAHVVGVCTPVRLENVCSVNQIHLKSKLVEFI
jgi:hypothetical protein